MPTIPQFNPEAQDVIERAQQLAVEYNHEEIKVLHLLLAIAEQDNSFFDVVVSELKLNKDTIINDIQKQLGQIANAFKMQNFGQIALDQEVIMVLEKSARYSKETNSKYISPVHILLAISTVNSSAKTLLEKYKINTDVIWNILNSFKNKGQELDEHGNAQYKALEKYSQNLTELARAHKLDPLIGREEELYHIMQILSRRTKNNPVLLGEPGVGKTAIVEGLAQKIIENEVPDNLKNKEIISLDIGALVAGTKFRGEFEDRLKSVLKEIKASEGKYIIFIDELQTIVGVGAAEGSIDASNLLKPALARGELHLIGATTYKDYRNSVEKDPALERRFQPVIIDEPSIEDTITILRGLKPKYEVFHGVKITDSAIRDAVNLSVRYIPDRFLPDKAIDLIDEAASHLKLQMNSVPPTIANIQKEIRTLEIEKEALKKEEDKESQKRLSVVNKKLETLKKEEDKLLQQWNSEKEPHNKIHELKQQIENLEREAQNFEKQGSLDKVAEIIYGKIPMLKKEIAKIEHKTKKKNSSSFIQEEVTSEEIAKCVSQWTGIPVERMLENEKNKLANMENILSSRVIGQDEAISAVSRAIRRSRAGLSEEDKPIGSFMFLGPTGVGKTELAKALAEFMFDDEKSLIRIDMSEYMEKHSVARLIGSPPGYVGYEEGGQLTETIRHRPYSLILFDEIEKAHPEVFNILLQILDNGRLTDGKGRVVNFKNTIIIMTSNLGGEYISQMSSLGFNNITAMPEHNSYEEQKQRLKDKINEVLRDSFRPEFLNRIDEIIIFNPLQPKDIEKIVDIQIQKVVNRLKIQNILLNVDDSAKKWLALRGYDPQFGARPLKRLIQKSVLDPLADKIIKGEYKNKKQIYLTASKYGLVFKAK